MEVNEMVDFFDSNVIPYILKTFKVKDIIISGVTDDILLDEILKYEANFTKIGPNENPLSTLPNIENYDAIFLDDDPNWYTVFNELNIIKESNKEFPLVFICNNHFPNKRRDSYSNPNIIPPEFRKKYAKEFPICYKNEKIMINDGCYHACEDNSSKNGVSTAIEDFLRDNNHIGIMNINFINEITILYLKLPINQKRMDILLNEIDNEKIEDCSLSDKLIENKLLISYINKNNLYNEDFIDFEFELLDKDNIINDYENELRNQSNEINYKKSQMESIESKLNLKESKIEEMESKLTNKDMKIRNLENQIQIRQDNLNSTINKFNRKEIEFNNQIDSLTNNFNQIEKDLTSKENQIKSLKDDFSRKENELTIKDKDIQQKNNQILNQQNELDNFEGKLNSLKHSYTKQLSKIDNNKYCIDCFKEEISNNHLEIKYLKNNTLIKKILSPLSYGYLILKSSPKELSVNIKLYKAIKNSKCFDIGFYLNQNKDLIESKWCKYFSPELHYVCNGFDEGRTFNKKYFNRDSKVDLLDYLLTCDK